MDNAFSCEVWGHHTIPTSTVYSNLQNEGTCPGQSEHADDSSKKEEDNDQEE